jgi:O-antigen/teichoic acid export membrane protein
MTKNTGNTKRIAKNTIVLYIRMIVVTLIGLYTSRIILNSLGIADYGLYSVVGGIVSLFSFFRTSMVKCTQRFLNVEMALPNGRLIETFNTALLIHLCFAIIVFILAETVGLWFLNNYIQIPTGREFAAFFVYQTVVGGLLLIIVAIPFGACVVAHEHMGVFAIISIADCLLTLMVALFIKNTSHDRLITYGLLLFCIRILNFLFYVFYCSKKYPEARIRILFDKKICREMLGYTSWALFGHAMILGTNHGNSILVNMFHGVSSNAAMAVASQVNSHVLQLTGNFQTAFNPQITKSYANGDYHYLKNLVYSTSKISFYLLILIALPIILNIDDVLRLWLGKVPNDANIFCILMLVSGILQATTSPLNFSIMATGKIKWFQIVTGLVFVSDLFILYALFKWGLPAPTAMWVKIGIMFAVSFVRMYFAQKIIPCLAVADYFFKVLLPLVIISCICVIFSLFLFSFIETTAEKIVCTLLVVIFSCVSIIYFGLTSKERLLLVNIVKKKIK